MAQQTNCSSKYRCDEALYRVLRERCTALTQCLRRNQHAKPPGAPLLKAARLLRWKTRQPAMFNPGDTTMIWITPQYQDLRFGFEITMYISAR